MQFFTQEDVELLTNAMFMRRTAISYTLTMIFDSPVPVLLHQRVQQGAAGGAVLMLLQLLQLPVRKNVCLLQDHCSKGSPLGGLKISKKCSLV